MPTVVSRQDGEQTCTTSTAIYNITISSVTTSRSIVLISCRAGQYTNSFFENKYMWTGTLTSSTNLQIASSSAIEATMYVRWQIIEFDSGTSVQRGEQSVVSSAQLSTISSVDLTKSWGISYLRASSDPFTGPMTICPRGDFSSATAYRCNTHSAYSYTATHSWQVITQDDVTVEEKTVNLTNSAASDDITITQVDADKSFIMGGFNPPNATDLGSANQFQGNMIRQYRFEPHSSTATNVRTSGYQAYTSGMNMIWTGFIVTSPSGILTAQYANQFFDDYSAGPPQEDDHTVTLVTTVDSTQSMLLLNGSLQSWMPFDGNSEETSCDFAYTGQLVNDTSVRLRRHDRSPTTLNAYSYCYFTVVEFGSESIPEEPSRRKQVFVT